ncbi:MAG: hypothetical protein HYY18_13690 [Planctomycetes bacterium]|nr:hypothetical protein [Planctomycetota bacterium]
MNRVLCVVVAAAVAAAWAGAEDEPEGKPMREPAPVCTCGGCRGMAETTDTRQCERCDGWTSTGAHPICSACAHALDLCQHCGKTLPVTGPMMILRGRISLVDKQPEKDLRYYVIETEGGGNQGVYLDPNRPIGCEASGRVLVRAMDDGGKGARVLVREMFALGPLGDDKEVKVKSDVEVCWRAGGIVGPAIAPKDGECALTLPAVKIGKIYVMAGRKILKTYVYDLGTWTEEASGK